MNPDENSSETGGWEEPQRLQPAAGQSRRSFLRKAVLTSAGVATAVGAGLAVGPQLLGHVIPAEASPSCGGALTKDDVSSGQSEVDLEDSTYAESIQAGDCVTITNKNDPTKTQQLHVASTQIVNNGTVVQLTFSAFNGLSGTTNQAFPAHSCVVISTCPS